MRWGIADVEAWLASIEPRVIDAWLAFESIEPEAFAERRADGEERRGGGELLDARESARKMAKRFGG